MHYSLAVLLDGTKTLEEAMYPFYEIGGYTPGFPCMEFHSEEEDYREQYDTSTCPMVMVDGELVSKYDERFTVYTERGIKHGVVPEGLDVIDVPFTVAYGTFDEFMGKWNEIERDPVAGEYGYWENPNAKWDWYVVGGRWKNIIEAKVGGFGRRFYNEYEFHGFLSERNRDPYPDDDTHFDIARVCDVIDINPDFIFCVLTPDGAWHEKETYHRDNPHGSKFVKDPDWNRLFYSRFIEPYQDCVLTIVDFHI